MGRQSSRFVLHSLLLSSLVTLSCGSPIGAGDFAVTTGYYTNDRPTESATAAQPSLTEVFSVAAAGLPSGWTAKGCWIDSTGARILQTGVAADGTMTTESCVASCIANGFSIAGAEYGDQCYCGNQIIEGGTQDTGNPTGCNMACGGNAGEICGGPNRMSIYSNYTGSMPVLAPPVTQTTGLPGNWEYVGCLSDNGADHLFPWQLVLPANNSAETCLTQCSNFGYGRGGMEYGDECYCGDLSDVQSSGATIQPDTDCNMVCSGNGSYFCGAGNRISYYEWKGSGLAEWTYASGADAGQYEFLISGPMVPLISTPGINGKVVFVEKHNPVDNSTGTYELDLTKLDDYNAAWRPLHVQTDVFCSAGLVLPDKVGRMINVGGWSDNSLLGIRLFTPSGSPGVAGDSDWEENYEEVALQNGRWYPSAMILANGSILVVGGENGSNGPPVPTLEILPKPPGATTVYLDFLKRTDPNNLYPYLTVLPSSGNVFIAYYNEARILDAGSFDTVKTLPNIPGQVNNNVTGRTYPLEGASVLMPQRAPYTEPLTITICGGADLGPGIPVGTDNCVSIQPEAANPTWTIERMPSGRVMTCMVALPDGTYLINNGAFEGTAGFGLGTNPNTNAVLYDPSKPVNQRMTVMANTTIARMYHSESVLLDDGRVLVSGSDPEDSRYPQQYGIEVFLPPYLLSGKPRPSFLIAENQRDWAYGNSYTITNVNTPNGGPASVTLLGAVASTHGNSMGQRTIMPAVSCSGGSCSITAPPNVKIAPAGWFQLFVLDNGIPSTASWVRIGGDPGNLGSWPSGFSDFTPPGEGPVSGYVH